MRIVDVAQGTPQWLYERSGKITASRIKDVMAMNKNGSPSAKRENYLAELVSERLTGIPTEHYVSPAMDHGTEMEKFARETYSIESGNEVERVGLILHPTLDYAAASPDGLIGKDGALEAKCPTTKTHIEYLLNGVLPDEHFWQCQWVIACAEREWLDFVSYDDRLPDVLQLFTVRVLRDEKKIAAAELAVIQFNQEIEDVIGKLKARVGEFPMQKLKKYSGEEEFLTEEDWPWNADGTPKEWELHT